MSAGAPYYAAIIVALAIGLGSIWFPNVTRGIVTAALLLVLFAALFVGLPLVVEIAR